MFQKQKYDDFTEYHYTTELIRFLQMKDTIATWPDSLHRAINRRAKEFFEELQADVFYLLDDKFKYDDLDEIDGFRSMIQAFPKSLGEDSIFNNMNTYAIHRAAADYDYRESINEDRTIITKSYKQYCDLDWVHLVPMMAEISINFNVHGKDMRGGLLCENKLGSNVLQMLTWRGETNFMRPESFNSDDVCLDVIKELRGLGLFKKEDIQEHNLLWELCSRSYYEGKYEGQKRFAYLSDWDPNALKARRSGGQLLLHLCTWLSHIEGFEMVLKAGIRHFPRDLGFLFHENSMDGDTAYLKARGTYGMKTVLDTIDRALRDPDCRKSLEEVEGEIRPFMVAASLDALYFLIRRDPPTLDFQEYEQHNFKASSVTKFDEAEGDHVNISLKKKRKIDKTANNEYIEGDTQIVQRAITR